MINLLDHLRSLNPHFKDIITQEIVNDGKSLGYQCFARDNNNNVFSGGTSSIKETAVRIAIAEAFERSFVQYLINQDHEKEIFHLDSFPTTSGFAVGFNKEQTRYRAICEGLERWVWSKWIDEGYSLDSFNPQITFSPLISYLLESFSETYWFRKNFIVSISDSETIDLHITVFLGCTDSGIFPGSRVTTENDDLFSHPIIEAHRNFSNFRIHQSFPFDLKDIIQKRAIYYGSHKSVALNQIQRTNKNEWLPPKIRLLKDLSTGHPNLFLYRCLMKDFIGWHEGDVTRFVY